MKRRAFTVVELLVVVAIIALLVTLMMPSLTTARDLSRATVCRHNLEQIGRGFVAAASDHGKFTNPEVYPDARAWPGIPYQYVPQDRIFLCPEDTPGDWDVIAGLEYVADWGSNPVFPFTDGHRGPAVKICSRGRRGSDEYGGFWDYVFEENYQYEHGCEFWNQRTWHPNGPDFSDNDGVFRIYDNHPSRGRLLRLHYYTCSLGNRATLFDKGLFNPEGTLLGLQGSEVVLQAFYTSYGINRNVNRVEVALDTVVLMDYMHENSDKSFIADPQSPRTNARLNLSGRHLGKINVLRADGAVQSVSPAQLYPASNPDAWSP